MNWLITLILIVIGIVIVIAIFIGFVVFLIYAVAMGIGYKNETEASAWDYWETMKWKRWCELSDDEKEKMIMANQIIADDIGIIVSREQLIELLEEQLPITEPKVGLSYTFC